MYVCVYIDDARTVYVWRLKHSHVLPLQAEMVEKTGMTDQDLWIYEMRYRVAVGVLQETWAICSKGLGDLFTHMKATEMTRRQVRNWNSRPSYVL